MSEHAEVTSRVVLIFGGSSGIGRATAHLLAAEGDTLVLAARSSQTLEAARAECVSRGAADVLVMPADVGEAEAVDAVLEAAAARFGRVDVVVNAAAVLAYGRFDDVPVDVFDRVLTTNVTGTANVARAALRQFAQQGGGSLVVVGSVVGKIAVPYMSTYVASKWALQGLVRTLQIEARATPGVRISLVSPGGVNTPIYDQAGSYTGHPGSPPPPVVSPERVARAVIRAAGEPSRDLAVGVLNAVLVAGFRTAPGLYDLLVSPMMRLLGQGRGSVESNPGNVFEPDPDREAVRGRWPRIWG